MEHVVFFPAHDGSPAFRRVSSLEDAVRLVEHLRNVENVAELSVHALTEVPLAFKTFYRVEVPADEVVPAVAPAALTVVPSVAPVEVVEAPVEEPLEVPVEEPVAELVEASDVPPPLPVEEPAVVEAPIAEEPVAVEVPAQPVAEEVEAPALVQAPSSLGFFAS